jgi:hypothetical protein
MGQTTYFLVSIISETYGKKVFTDQFAGGAGTDAEFQRE